MSSDFLLFYDGVIKLRVVRVPRIEFRMADRVLHLGRWKLIYTGRKEVKRRRKRRRRREVGKIVGSGEERETERERERERVVVFTMEALRMYRRIMGSMVSKRPPLQRAIYRLQRLKSDIYIRVLQLSLLPR